MGGDVHLFLLLSYRLTSSIHFICGVTFVSMTLKQIKMVVDMEVIRSKHFLTTSFKHSGHQKGAVLHSSSCSLQFFLYVFTL